MTKEAAMIMVTGKGTQKKDPTKAKATWKIIGKTMIYAVVDLPFMLDPEHIDSQNVHNSTQHPDEIRCVITFEELEEARKIMQTRRERGLLS